ncbi:MAG TPA: hypothetical protein VFH22_13425, partial [Rhodocyclaceae bacterium]|nr:hypothetical protein [Rhodocyclaceae bacterium]
NGDSPMKANLSLLRNAILLAAGLSLAVAAHAAPAHQHGAPEAHGAAAKPLQLDAGKKWATDEALRQAMGKIRQAVAASMHDIHQNRLPAAGYATLARKVEGEVGNIVANCKLAPQADAQLHLVIADLLAGAGTMAGQVGKAPRRDGAVQVIGALEKYASYFDDPGFKPLPH